VRQSQFRGPRENVGQDFQTIDNGGIADIGVNIPQKLPDVVRQGDGGEMRCLHRRQGFGQPRSHIIFHTTGDAGIARHLSAQAHEFMSRFVMAETLRGLNELQEVGRLKLSDRLSANDRENRILQIAAQFLGVLFGERRLVLGEPFPRHKLKGIPLFPLFGEFFFSGLLFLLTGVNPLGKQFLGVITPMAGIFQRNRRIRAKAQQFLLALKSVGHPP